MKNKPTKEHSCFTEYGGAGGGGNLSSILKEADKSFDEKFGCRENCSCSIFDYMIEYWHSQIELAYNKGLEDEFASEKNMMRALEEVNQESKQQTLKQIEEWADEEWVALIGDVKLLHYEDLKKFINTL
jgi:hypothetical protein